MTAACRPTEVEAFRTLVARHLGLEFDDSKLGEIADLLSRRTSATKVPCPAYIEGLADPGARQKELRALAHELTVHETYFFRNTEQFRAFAEVALPDRMRANTPKRRLRILSAGCASGEEPYSLAILASQLPGTAGWDLSIRGFDVSTAVLEHAARGHYSAWALRDTPVEVRNRYFRADGRDFVLDETIRRMVSFEERNLIDAPGGWLEPGTFDIIFCRNVIMYFTPEAARAAVAQLAQSLAPGGFLFLGHAETLRGLSQDFHLRQSHEAFYYQRRGSIDPGGPIAERPPGNSVLDPSSPVGPGPRFAGQLPDDSWVHIIRRASDRIESMVKSASPEPPESAPAPPRASLDLGPALDLLHRERYGEAHAMLGALPAEDATQPDALLLKAVLLTHGGDLARAEELCRDVLAMDEMCAGAHYVLALCRENVGDPGGAKDHDRAALYLDPAFAMPRLHLGLIARRSGRRDEGRHELQQALVLLRREDASRVLMFGGGFSRDTLIALCQAELASCGGAV